MSEDQEMREAIAREIWLPNSPDISVYEPEVDCDEKWAAMTAWNTAQVAILLDRILGKKESQV